MIELALAVVFLLALFAQQRVFGAERREWTKERQLLITKIQHPEFIVATPEKPVVSDEEIIEAEPDDIDLVGTIRNGDGPD